MSSEPACVESLEVEHEPIKMWNFSNDDEYSLQPLRKRGKLMEYVARERYKMAGCNQLGYPGIHSLGPFGDPEGRDGRNSGEMLQSL